MRRPGLFVLVLVTVVSLVGAMGCGGGGGSTAADPDPLDPTGTEWQFLVTTAGAGESLYTLTFFNSEGVREASGLFTATSGGGASFSGSWSVSGNVVNGTTSGVFRFTLAINADSTTGTIDYVTEEGAGSAEATRIDSSSSDCSQYAGNWAGTFVGTACEHGVPGVADGGSWASVLRSDCTASMAFTDASDTYSFEMAVAGNTISGSLSGGGCDGSETIVMTATLSGGSLSGTYGSQTVQGTWSGAKL